MINRDDALDCQVIFFGLFIQFGEKREFFADFLFQSVGGRYLFCSSSPSGRQVSPASGFIKLAAVSALRLDFIERTVSVSVQII